MKQSACVTFPPTILQAGSQERGMYIARSLQLSSRRRERHRSTMLWAFPSFRNVDASKYVDCRTQEACSLAEGRYINVCRVLIHVMWACIAILLLRSDSAAIGAMAWRELALWGKVCELYLPSCHKQGNGYPSTLVHLPKPLPRLAGGIAMAEDVERCNT